MPQLRFPKRDTEGLSSALVDNDRRTYVSISSGGSVTVSYAAPKHVYAIIVIPDTDSNTIDLRNVIFSITEDGSSYYSLLPYMISSNMTQAYNKPYWWVNKSIKGWQLRNNSSATWRIGEIIVLTPDDTKPYLEVSYPSTIEIIDSGTTNLDFFSNLSNISDGDDNTYATFAFGGGYSTYTLYLKGEFALPMASVISPFALIEIDPQSSNIGSVIRQINSHGYFLWGLKDTISYVTGFIYITSVPLSILNSPRKLWSQKVYEDYDTGSIVKGVFSDNILAPTYYAPITGSFSDGTAFLEALRLETIINQKTLYVPYFFSLRHRPIFIAGEGYHIYYTTDNIAEPFIYVAANGSTNKIYLKFGLRIETSSTVTSDFTVKIYGLGFLLFPQMDVEVPLTLPDYNVWFAHTPLGSVTRDNNEATESPDITTDEKSVSIYPVAVDVSSGRAIRYRIRSTSGGTSTFNVDRYYGFHRASDDQILWYYKRDSYSVGDTLQSFDVTGEDQLGQTKVIKVEIKPT
jgi:hypothetical protein